MAAPLTAVPLWTENNFWRWWFDRSQPHDIFVHPLCAAAEAVRSIRRPIIGAALGPEVALVGALGQTGSRAC